MSFEETVLSISEQLVTHLQYEMDRHFPGVYSSTWMWSSSLSRIKRSVCEYSTSSCNDWQK